MPNRLATIATARPAPAALNACHHKGVAEDIVTSIVVFLNLSLRNTNGTVFQGANSVPVPPQQYTGLLVHPGRKRVGVAARLKAYAGKFTGFFGSLASPPGIAAKFATDRGLVLPKQSGNLRDVVPGFHKAVNLINSLILILV
jgi:hypothetical protein